ncbi:MAG: hypothetical protein AB8B73_14740 [Ekhidna sp.]
MKILFIISCLICSLGVFGQRSYLNGVVRDSLSKDDMVGVHIRNIDAGSVTSSNAYGKFKIPIQTGDTLILSSVGHQTLAWIVLEEWLRSEEREFLLPVNTIYLDEVVIGELPKYDRFKEMIMEAQPVDTSLQIFGVKPVVITGDKRLEEANIKNPLYALTSPIDFVYQNLSKREKEKRHHYRLVKSQYKRERVNIKFNREWVAEMTQLEGDKLTSFIAYCNFQAEYLAKTPLYMINERMTELMPEFLKTYNTD